MAGEWFLIRSKYHSGDGMKDWRADLQKAGVETYYPLVRELRKIPQRKMSAHQRLSRNTIMRYADVPLLPRNVFARGGDYRLLSLPGVLGVVTNGEQMITFRDIEIDRLKRREVDGVILGKTPADMIFRRDDKVEVVNGPFSGFDAKIDTVPNVAVEEIDADTRLTLILNLFGRSVRTHVTAGDVRKIVD